MEVHPVLVQVSWLFHGIYMEKPGIHGQIRHVHGSSTAGEACYLVLQMPLRRSSKQVVFVDTNKENERVVLMKPMSVLKELPKTSTSIESDSNIKHYQRRPNSMNRYCLADFIALFHLHFSKKGNEQCENNTVESEELPETSYELNSEDDLEMHDASDFTEEHVLKMVLLW
jgi:hypothetical protein